MPGGVAYAGVGEALDSILGTLGEVAEGAVEGFGAGGILGAITGGIGALFGITSGGDTMTMTNGNGAMGGIPDIMAGPGVAEPQAQFVKRQWTSYSGKGGNIKTMFWLLNDLAGKYAGYVLYWVYNPYKTPATRYGTYKPKKAIVLSADPRISHISKAERTIVGKEKKLAKVSKNLVFKR